MERRGLSHGDAVDCRVRVVVVRRDECLFGVDVSPEVGPVKLRPPDPAAITCNEAANMNTQIKK